MSDESLEKERGELATDRLLQLLRSEQAGVREDKKHPKREERPTKETKSVGDISAEETPSKTVLKESDSLLAPGTDNSRESELETPETDTIPEAISASTYQKDEKSATTVVKKDEIKPAAKSSLEDKPSAKSLLEKFAKVQTSEITKPAEKLDSKPQKVTTRQKPFKSEPEQKKENKDSKIPESEPIDLLQILKSPSKDTITKTSPEIETPSLPEKPEKVDSVKAPQPETQDETSSNLFEKDKLKTSPGEEPEASIAHKESESSADLMQMLKDNKLTSKPELPSTTESKTDIKEKDSPVTKTEYTLKTADTGLSIDAGVPATDVIQQIDKQKSKTEVKEEDEVQPEEFDSTQYSALEKKEKSLIVQLYINAVFHFLNESRRRVTLHFSDESIRLLHLTVGLRRTKIEKAADYSLPYKTENDNITDYKGLLTHILESEIDPQYRKSIYCGVFNPAIPMRTKIIQTPAIKKAEMADLVEWNVKKNVPFNPDDACSDWESSAAVGDSTKQNVVIGVAEKGQMAELINKFKEYKVKLRLLTTLPILLWKSFTHNYPDRKSSCYAIVYIDKTQTTIAVVSEQKLLFSREIAFGTSDFYKAIMQKVIVDDKTVEIDYKQAQYILNTYGIPRDTSGVIPQSGISLYKISIFLRPAVERLTNEIGRSMNYFKKQNPDMDWQSILLDGSGATFPNLIKTVKDNLDIETELLNPVRTGRYSFKKEAVITDRFLPFYSLNFAIATDEATRLNILPKSIRTGYKFIFLSKLAIVLLAFFIPFFLLTTLLSSMEIESLTKKIADNSNQWNKLSFQSKEYFGLTSDVEILEAFKKFLKNDRNYSKNQISILKILSSKATSDIKFTSVVFKKEVIESNNPGTQNSYLDVVDIQGFVQSDPSIADIHLTNFVIQLEQLKIFSQVKMEMEEQSDTENFKLFFTCKLRL